MISVENHSDFLKIPPTYVLVRFDHRAYVTISSTAHRTKTPSYFRNVSKTSKCIMHCKSTRRRELTELCHTQCSPCQLDVLRHVLPRTHWGRQIYNYSLGHIDKLAICDVDHVGQAYGIDIAVNHILSFCKRAKIVRLGIAFDMFYRIKHNIHLMQNLHKFTNAAVKIKWQYFYYLLLLKCFCCFNMLFLRFAVNIMYKLLSEHPY